MENQQDLSAHESGYHVPVLLQESIDALNIQPSGTYVDCTFGGGGHSRSILDKLDKKGKLIVFDQDEAAKANLPADERVVFIPQNFRHLQRFLRLHDVTGVEGILADLGVSSHQFDEGSRGFSIRYDAPLDMRMDTRQQLTAAKLLEEMPEEKLHKLFEQYGEVTNAKTLARTIAEKRKISPITTISQLKHALSEIVKGNPNKYFAQVFQALRIEVNDELGALKELLQQGMQVLKPGGRFAIISFHSLEDRLVKNFFRFGNFEEEEKDEIYGTKANRVLKIISKKPVVASAKELKINNRARSAKLRIAEKI